MAFPVCLVLSLRRGRVGRIRPSGPSVSGPSPGATGGGKHVQTVAKQTHSRGAWGRGVTVELFLDGEPTGYCSLHLHRSSDQPARHSEVRFSPPIQHEWKYQQPFQLH